MLAYRGRGLALAVAAIVFLCCGRSQNDAPGAGDGGSGGSAGESAGGHGGTGGQDGEGGSGEIDLTIRCPTPLPIVPGPEDPSVSMLRYKKVSVGSFSCGIDEEDRLSCWGDWDQFGTPLPEGRFRDLAVGWCQACAVSTDGAISCWGCPPGDGGITPPAGKFVTVTVGRQVCGLTEEGKITCTGSSEGPSVPGPFVKIAAGMDVTCALSHVDGPNIHCWGKPDSEALHPPSIHAVDIGGGPHHFCAILDTGELACWGASAVGQTEPPLGPFSAVDGTCGIRPDGRISCWSGGSLAGLRFAPPGCFYQLAARGHACALRNDEHVVCWNAAGEEGTPP